MERPKVSVVMAVHNGEKHLFSSVESILDQTFGKFEFIIVNDGSTDSTGRILDGYKDPRITVLQNSSNIGHAKSLNTGIRNANGAYIARMDADDIALPRRLEKQVRFMDRNNMISILGTACFIIDEKGEVKRIGNTIFGDHRIKRAIARNDENAPVWHPTAVFRAEALIEAGMYNESLRCSEDKDLWIRMADMGYRFENMKEPLLKRRGPEYRTDFEEHRRYHKTARDHVYAINKEAVGRLRKRYKDGAFEILCARLKNNRILRKIRCYSAATGKIVKGNK